jgi:fimbrial chaperone protein
MTQELTVEGSNRKAAFYVMNTGDKPIAIIIELKKRTISSDGKEINNDIDDEFIVFPDQMIVKAGEKRAVQVTWLGKEKPVVEQAYRVIAEQLPIDVDLKKNKKQRTNIKILLKYRAAFYLTPENAKPNVTLMTSKALVENGLVNIALINEGSKHKLLRDFSLKLSSKGETKTVSFSKIKSIYGENLLAKAKRDFKIKIDDIFPKASELKVELIKE